MQQYKGLAARSLPVRKVERDDMITVTITKPFEQIVRKAESELAVLDRSEREAQATIATIRAETATIEARIQARAGELRTCFETASALAAHHDMLVSQQSLAIGTLQEGKVDSQVKAAAKEREKSERALTTLEARIVKEDGADSIRIQALANERARCCSRLDEIDRQRTALVAAKDAAQRDMGEALLLDVLAHHQAAQLRMVMLEEQLHQAEGEDAQMLVEAVHRLDAWPDLQREMKALVPVDDATSRILSAAMSLYGLLLDEGEQVVNDANLLRQISPWIGHATDLLRLDASDLWPISTHRPEEALTIRDRKQQFEKLLALYRQRQQQA
jgi:hypothetical protein